MLYGLSEKEAYYKLKEFGKNVFYKEKNKLKVLLELFLDNLKDIFNLLLALAFIIALILNKNIEAILIFIFLIVNVFLSVFYEFKAFLELEKLKKSFKTYVLVIREGKKKKIDSELLVPGDLVILGEGDLIPADGRIIKGKVKVDESILTGEFNPNEKKKGDFLFKGTLITEGNAILKVEKTGLNTKIGLINKEIFEIKKERTLLEKELNKINFLLFKTLLIFAFILLVFGFYYKLDFKFLLLLILSLIIAAIPQSLPVLITLNLIKSSRDLSKEGILVKKLNSIENLAITDYFLTDKTGTLIENKFEIDKIYGDDKEKILKLAALASFNEKDPIDSLFLKYKDLKEEDYKPFNSRDKYSYAKIKDLIVYKGSPQAILNLYLEKNKGINYNELNKWENLVEKEVKKGNKLILIGVENTLKKEFKIVGLISLKVKLKKGVEKLIKKLIDEGLKIIILTGDKKENTEVILKELGLDGKIVDRTYLINKSEGEIANELDNIIAITEVYPEDKLKVIEIIKKYKKKTVSMLGDGVNDSLALKKADVSIVVGDGSELAKNVADIVLLDSDLSKIEKIIKKGRNVIYSIKKMVLFILPTNIIELFVGSFGVVFKKLVLKPIQILWINLVTDSLPSFLYFFDKERDLKKAEVYPFFNIFDKKFFAVSSLIFLAFISFTYYYIHKNLFLIIIIWEMLNFLFVKYYFDEEFNYKQLSIIVFVFLTQLIIIYILKEIFDFSLFNEQELKLLALNLITFSILFLIYIEMLKLKKEQKLLLKN
jgi:P-type E1-E2 ATPase